MKRKELLSLEGPDNMRTAAAIVADSLKPKNLGEAVAKTLRENADWTEYENSKAI